MIEREGGLLAAVDARLQRSDNPIVGVVSLPDQEPACAIPSDGRWAFLTPDGVAICDPVRVAATVVGFA